MLRTLGTPNFLGGAVDVRSKGAVFDGVTDDSAAIRTALTSAATFGLATYIPPGTGVVSRDGANAYCLDLPAGTRLTGEGTLKLAASQSGTTSILNVATTGVTVSGVTLDGNKANNSVNAQNHGIYTSGANKLAVRNVRITGCGGDSIHLGAAGSMSQVSITGCRMDASDRNGITLYATGSGSILSDILIANNDIECAVQPIDSEPVSGGHVDRVRIIGNRLYTTSNYAITTPGSAVATPSVGWVISGNIMQGSVYITWATDLVLANNYIDATLSTVSAVRAYQSSTNVRVTGNIIRAATGLHGVDAEYSSSTAPDGLVVSGNSIYVLGASDDGVRAWSCGTVVITDNHVYGVNSSHGIYVRASSADARSATVANNVVDGFVSGILASVSSTWNMKRLVLTGNSIDNTQGSPTMTTGLQLSGTAAQFVDTVVSGNTINPSYTTPTSFGSVLVRAAGTSKAGQYLGSGTPEGVVTAGIGSTFTRTDGGNGTTLYIKESGTGNTGWITYGATTSTTTNLASVSATINTVGKYAGKTVFNTNTHKNVTAGGALAADLWYDQTGTTAHTPV